MLHDKLGRKRSAIAFSEFIWRECLWLKGESYSYFWRKCHTSPPRALFCKESKLSFSVLENNTMYWNIFFFPLRKFLRVLPLPSENWSALVEEWCCHPNPFARSTLHPQHADCFLGDTFFLLNSGNESHVPESPVCCSEAGHHASESGSNLVKYFV